MNLMRVTFDIKVPGATPEDRQRNIIQWFYEKVGSGAKLVAVKEHSSEKEKEA